MKRTFRLATVSFFFVAIVAGCATSPTGRQQLRLFPEDQIQQMGAAAFNELSEALPRSTSAREQAYARCVADHIVQQLPASARRDWVVQVFEDPSPNAFALPSGHIGVHTGMLELAENQHQLAAVMGHEVAHVIAQHTNERVSTAYATSTAVQLVQSIGSAVSPERGQLLGLLGVGAQLGVILPFNRVQESESDVIGLELMARAGFDPRASVDLWRNMEKVAGSRPPEFLSTHPSHGTRIATLQRGMDGAMALYNEARASGRQPRCQ